MSEQTKEHRDGRMIHVRLPEDIHRALRIKVAEADTTIQDWVAELIEKNVRPAKKIG